VKAWAGHRHRLLEVDVVVDALLGTGLRKAPEGLLADVIGELAVAHAERGTPIVAVDIPSGLPSDGGDVPWNTASATLTVTFAAPKWGHVVAPACNLVGEVRIADIGIPRRVLEETGRTSGCSRTKTPRVPSRRASRLRTRVPSGTC